MARRRVWNSLSSDYRTRLLRKGITQEAYEAGASLKAARGHAETPEHPEEAAKNPQKYKKYVRRLASLQKEVWERKQRLWDTRFKWNDQRAKENVFRREASSDGISQVPRRAELLKFLAASDDEWEANVMAASFAARQGLSDDWNALFYH